MSKEVCDRYNEGKLLYGLIPSSWSTALAKVLTFGCEKYSPDNWKLGGDWRQARDSMERHWHAWASGESYDPESNCHHLAHLAWNALCLMWWEINGRGYDNVREIANDNSSSDSGLLVPCRVDLGSACITLDNTNTGDYRYRMGRGAEGSGTVHGEAVQGTLFPD